MQNLKNDMGKRLREIRHVFFEGRKVSTRQFAEFISETKDNIANYENGRAFIPNRLLVSLYLRGYNPIFLLTGESSMYADNEAGAALRAAAASQIGGSVEILSPESDKRISIAAEPHEDFSVAAGDVSKAMNKNKKNRGQS